MSHPAFAPITFKKWFTGIRRHPTILYFCVIHVEIKDCIAEIGCFSQLLVENLVWGYINVDQKRPRSCCFTAQSRKKMLIFKVARCRDWRFRTLVPPGGGIAKKNIPVSKGNTLRKCFFFLKSTQKAKNHSASWWERTATEPLSSHLYVYVTIECQGIIQKIQHDEAAEEMCPLSEVVPPFAFLRLHN